MSEKKIAYKSIIMRCDSINKNAFADIPERFAVVKYCPGMESIWMKIQEDAGQFDNYTDEGILEYFSKTFLQEKGVAEERCLFLKDVEEERYIGVCSAWFSRKEGKEIPLLHWLAVVPEYRRIGCARMLITETMKIFMQKYNNQSFIKFECAGGADVIKVMTIDDYEELFEMWKNTPNMGLRSLDDSKEGISFFLRRNPNTNFVAYKNNKLVGAILSGHDGRRGYIYHTVVLPEYRGRGIASNLVDKAVEALQKEGITRVCLNVMETNEQGKKFWIGKGWEKKDFLGFYSKAITNTENLPLFKI